MPLYEYYCKENEEVISVRHAMSESIATWQELCTLAKVDVGDTNKNAKVEKIISGGLQVPRKTNAPVEEKSSCNTGGCGCC